MDSKHELFKKIQILHFVILDIALYLDTHPTDQAALDYYHKYNAMNTAAEAEYTSCYGPITMYDVDAKNNWTWIEKPWPWEMEA